MFNEQEEYFMRLIHLEGIDNMANTAVDRVFTLVLFSLDTTSTISNSRCIPYRLYVYVHQKLELNQKYDKLINYQHIIIIETRSTPSTVDY